MAALLVSLLAAAAAALGGRWALLAAASLRHHGPAAGWPAAMTALVAAGGAAWLGADLAARFAGPGMLLFLALALVFAAPTLLFAPRPLDPAITARLGQWPAALILLAAALVSDGAPFIILAVAAWTGQPLLAATGGLAGLALAVLAGAALPLDRAMLLWSRRGLAALLLLSALFAATRAMAASL